MGIDQPIYECDDCIFKGNPALSMWVDVERHVIITLDIHELIVQVQHRSDEWLLLKVSKKRCPIHAFCVLIKDYN